MESVLSGIFLKLYASRLLPIKIHIGDDSKVLLALALHKLSDHNFKGVLRHKTTDNKVIVLLRQPFFLISAHQLFIIVSQLAEGQICTVGNKSCFWISAFDSLTVIALVDVFFDILIFIVSVSFIF